MCWERGEGEEEVKAMDGLESINNVSRRKQNAEGSRYQGLIEQAKARVIVQDAQDSLLLTPHFFFLQKNNLCLRKSHRR